MYRLRLSAKRWVYFPLTFLAQDFADLLGEVLAGHELFEGGFETIGPVCGKLRSWDVDALIFGI